MNNEKMKHEEKLLLSLKNKLKVHIVLTDGSWRNGFVRDISADFFMFEDAVNGLEPLFFLDLKAIEPFMEGGKWK